MKSSRQRFAEFREKIRTGVLDPVRYGDPSVKREEKPEDGMRAGPGSARKHVFKRKKNQLIAEYRVMLRGYGKAMGSLFFAITMSTLVTMLTPIVLKLLIDYVAAGRALSEVPWLARSFLGAWVPQTAWGGLKA